MHPVRRRARVAAALFALLLVNCELFVQLDRSAADAGEDAGCPICGDADRGDATDGAARPSLDATYDGTALDASPALDAPDGSDG